MRENVPAASVVLPAFTAAHYAKLCENEYYRYMPNSDVIGHVLVDERGQATQFALPDHTTNLAAPMIGELRNLTQFDLPNNKKTVLGYVNQEPMISRRAYSISIAYEQEDPTLYTFYPLSPKKNPVTQEDRPIIYNTEYVERFKDTAQARREIREIQQDMRPQAEVPASAERLFESGNKPNTKAGACLEIKNEDLPIRMSQKRTPDQNTVMGRYHLALMAQATRRAIRRQDHQDIAIASPRTASRNAVTEMQECLDHYRDVLSDNMIRILERSVKAPFNSSEAGQARGEWLHRDGHNLHPLTIDPQRPDNLGAAEKRYNTEMMIIERTVQFFALNVPQSHSKIQSDFEMLLDSDVIDMIHFMGCIQVAGFTIKMTQHIDVFQHEPQCVKASDLATLIGIMFCLMHKQTPRSIQSISIGRTDAAVIRFPGNFFHHKAESERLDSEERLLLS